MSKIVAAKVIFDLDGTLIDSAPDLHAATNHVLSSIGRDQVTLDQVRSFVGHGALMLIEKGLKATGGMENYSPLALRPAFLDFYGSNLTTHTRPFDGARDVLEHFQSVGVGMGICTNKPSALVRPILEGLGLDHYFSAITGGDTFDFKKPDPRHLLETAERIPGDGPILMVGDSAPDVDAARAAGVPSVAVTFGYSQTPAHELGADRVIETLTDLLDFVVGAPA